MWCCVLMSLSADVCYRSYFCVVAHVLSHVLVLLKNSCTYVHVSIPVVGFSACSHKLLYLSPFACLTSLVL